MSRFGLGVVIGLTVVVGAGCRALFGLEEGSEAPPWWITETDEGCTVARAPTQKDRPTVEDGESIPPFYLALTSLRIGGVDENLKADTDAWKEIGLDLDGQCTLSETCGSGRGSGCANSPQTDGYQCRDNALGELFSHAMLVQPDLTEQDLTCEIQRGGFNVLFKLSDYNGLRDDPRIRIDVYASVGSELGALPCRKDGGLEENWRSYSVWYELESIPSGKPWRIMPESIAASDSACFQDGDGELPGATVCDAEAYVRGSYVYASFEDARFWLNGREKLETKGFRTVLRRGIALAKISQNGQDRWEVEDGIVTGVTTAEDMLESFAQVGLCEKRGMEWEVVRGRLVNAQDMPLDPNASPDAPCDGVSIAWEFDALETGGGCVCAPLPDPPAVDAAAADAGAAANEECPVEFTPPCNCADGGQ